MLQKLCTVLSNLLLAVLAVLAALLLVPYLLGLREMAVLTGSMAPALPVGSLIYVHETDPATLKPGDVVTYRLAGDTVVTHRVVSVDTGQRTLVTQGDANDTADGAIAFESVVGRMLFHLPYLGYVGIYVRTRVGIVAICAVLVAVILLTFLPEIFAPEPPKDTAAHTDKGGKV